MERMIGLILIVSAIYIGVELYTEGDQAFGGLLASGGSSAPASSAPEPAAQRREPDWAGSRVKHSVTKMNVDRARRVSERMKE